MKGIGSSGTDVCALLLAKFPECGGVKVRLARQVGDDAATELYRNFVLDSLSMLNRSGIPFLICFHPADSLDRFRAWLGIRYDYMPQRGRNLGERLRNGLLDALSRGFRGTMAIGSDSPDLPEAIILEARDALQVHDVVIGPSPDGGYYLIGFKSDAFLPEPFEGIAWSTATVFRETMKRLKGGGRDVFILPPWNDIDTYDDLKAFGMRNSRCSSSQTMRYLFKHGDMLNGGGQ